MSVKQGRGGRSLSEGLEEGARFLILDDIRNVYSKEALIRGEALIQGFTVSG